MLFININIKKIVNECMDILKMFLMLVLHVNVLVYGYINAIINFSTTC